MRIMGLLGVVFTLGLFTGCQPQQRLATHIKAERQADGDRAYMVDIRVDRLDARGNSVETLTRPRILVFAGQRGNIKIGTTSGDRKQLVTGVSLDVAAPAEGTPQIVKVTTVLLDKGAAVFKGETEAPVTENAENRTAGEARPPQ
ncbi:MAG TPA: hypothetical protein VMV94_17845 [Phycisphaerae bacterium]|nr:hypothetical protein [Phycisphaerae bacterium]